MAEVKIKQWVDLACRLGVVEDTPDARKSYIGWINRDAAAAQRAVCAAIPGPPAAAAPLPPAVTASATAYPPSWASSVRAAQRLPNSRRSLPTTVTAAAASIESNTLQRAQANTGYYDKHALIASSNSGVRYAADLRRAEEERMAAEVWNR